MIADTDADAVPGGEEVALTAEQRDAVRDNGRIELPNVRFDIDGALVRTEYHSPVERWELLCQFRIWEEVLRLHQRLHVLAIDRSGTGPMPPDRRRLMAEWDRRFGADVVAIVNDGNRVTNTMIGLLIRAMSMLRPKPLKVALFTDEAAAREWLSGAVREARREGVPQSVPQSVHEGVPEGMHEG
ncbi:MAG: STAS/SEC14 domain-containing protein [Polyangia bacterium]